MRSAFAIAAFAASAIAVPFAENKRALEYENEVVYVTNVVTVTAYGSAPTEPAKAPHYGHKTTVTQAAQATAPVYSAPAPVYSAPSSSAPSSGNVGPSTDYQSAVVNSHNLHRANHSAPAVTWSDELYNCAKTVAESCNYAHDVYV